MTAPTDSKMMEALVRARLVGLRAEAAELERALGAEAVAPAAPAEASSTAADEPEQPSPAESAPPTSRRRRRGPSELREERLALGPAAVVKLSTASQMLPWDSTAARAWLRARGLVRQVDGGREVVTWGDVLAELRADPAGAASLASPAPPVSPASAALAALPRVSLPRQGDPWPTSRAAASPKASPSPKKRR